MKIACDIDDVIVRFVEKYMEFAAERGFKVVKYEDIYTYDLDGILGVSGETALDLLKIFNLEKRHENLNFIEGAVDGVNLLKNGHDVYFITARPKVISKFTRDFVFNNFRILGDRVIFSGDISGEGECKDEICKKMGVELIVEDNDKDSLRYARKGMGVLLLDKPWNRGVEHENIYRCMSWKDILKKVEELDDE